MQCFAWSLTKEGCSLAALTAQYASGIFAVDVVSTNCVATRYTGVHMDLK